MDVLGSILNSMDKPPTLTEREREMKKRRKEIHEKHQAAVKEKLQLFKENLEKMIIKHFENRNNTMLKFDPMDAVQRSIVHEVAESQNLLSYAFGTEGVDRYMRLYRKDHPPCEDELAARRRGDPWNEQIKQQLEQERRLDELQKLETEKSKKKKATFIPNRNYKDKYVHIIGEGAAIEAVKDMDANKTYGFVPSENKRDCRSIEQTMADIKAKKRQKLNDEESEHSKLTE